MKEKDGCSAEKKRRWTVVFSTAAKSPHSRWWLMWRSVRRSQTGLRCWPLLREVTHRTIRHTRYGFNEPDKLKHQHACNSHTLYYIGNRENQQHCSGQKW